MKTIHDDIRATIEKAEARAYKAAKKKLRAEHQRHESREAEIDAELQAELAKSKALRELLPKDEAPEPPTPEDDEPDLTQVPAAVAVANWVRP